MSGRPEARSVSKSIGSGLHGLSLAKLSIQPDIGVPTDADTLLGKGPSRLTMSTSKDAKRKLIDTEDLPLGLVKALVAATLQWTTQQARYFRQIAKDSMSHTVVRNAQGGFEVNVNFHRVRVPGSALNKKIDLPAPFEAPRDPLIQTVPQDTYNELEQAVWGYLAGKPPQSEDVEEFGPELTEKVKIALKNGPWEGLEIQKGRIRSHRDASTKSPSWHNDASNPLSEEVVTFYVRYNKGDGPLCDEQMPRMVKGPVPWVDMEQIAIRVLGPLGFLDLGSDVNFNGGPMNSLKSTYDRYIKDGINSAYFEVVPWPKNAFVRVSGTFHVGPNPTRKGQPKPGERKGRTFLAFRTGRTVADSMKATP